MYKIISMFCLLFVAIGAHAEYKCTDWKTQNGTSCTIAGKSADVYKRQCENPCWRGSHGRGNWGPDCDQQSVCSLSHPNTFDGSCSEWIEDSNTSCKNPSTDKYEQKWERACTVGLKESWCSDENPNN